MGKIISVDSGSSYMKAVQGDNQVMFPSAVRHTRTGRGGIVVGGKRYLVGQDALDAQASHDQHPNTDRWFHGSDAQHVQLCEALRRLGAEGDHDILLLTLPYESAVLEQFRDRVQRRTTFAWTDEAGDHKVNFARVRITPQGVGALRQYDLTRPSEIPLACLVDVGSCTTDIVTVRRTSGTGWRFVEDACRSSQDVSATAFCAMWQTALRRIPGFGGKTWGYWALMSRAIPPQNLTWPLNGEAVSIADQYHATRERFTDLLRAELQDATRSLWPDIEQIILTGGGASLVDTDYWADPRLITMDIWANAKGQFTHTQQREA